jgi:hypothetical protein
MESTDLERRLRPLIDFLAGRALDGALATDLEHEFPAAGPFFAEVEADCHRAIAAGWMCAQGGPGRRFGRVIQAGPATHGLSVDVVDLENIVGPHHRHPNGEICMVMPQNAEARFDGRPRGWCVYGPGSAHRPTVTAGRALVLYLLPDGRIEFTGQ